MKTKLRVLLSAALFASASISRADNFYPIAGITASTPLFADYFAANLIEGPGTGFDSAEPHDRLSMLTWVTQAPAPFPADYLAVASMPVLTVDLGVNVPLGEISVWGYSDDNANGASRISLKFATAAEGTAGFGTSITYNPVFEPQLQTAPRQSFPFTQTVTARYVQITCEDNFWSNGGQGPPPGGDRVGLGEIAFKLIATTPGPNLVAPANQDLPITGVLQTFSIPILNTGGMDLTITGVTFSGTNAAAFSAGPLPPTMQSLQGGTVTIQFNPAGLSGTISATMNIASNDGDSPVTPVLLTGKFPSFYPIISVSSATSLSDLYPASNLIQGAGVGFLANAPFTKLLTGQPGNWVTAAPGGAPSDYYAFAPPPVLTFDLGSNVLLNEISVWGYASTNTNGLKEFSLKFATEAEGTSNFGTSITYNPAFGNLSNADTVRQSFTFNLPVTCRYVEMTCLDNFYGSGAGGDRVGAGEVAFEIPSVSPQADIDAPLSQTLGIDGTVQNFAVSIRNTGTPNLTITSVNFTGPNAAAFSTVTVPATLTTFQKADIIYKFNPAGLAGPISATMNIVSNDPDESPKSIALSGLLRDKANALVAFWPLDDAPVEAPEIQEIDDAGGDHNGVATGFVTLQQPGARPFSGTSAMFDGFSAINVPWSAETNPPAFTVVAWANSAGGGDFNSVITSRSDSAPNQGGYIIYDDNVNNWAFWTGSGIGSSGWNVVTGPAVVPDWTHLALVYDDFTRVKTLYVDGVLAASTTVNVGPVGSIPEIPERELHIGAGGDMGVQYYYSGGIDEVAVFNVPLTAADIAVIRDSGVAAFAGLAAPSNFFITTVVRNANGSVSITFNSETGRTYKVQRSNAVSGWTDLTDNLASGGASTSYTDTTITAATPRVFYRVMRNP